MAHLHNFARRQRSTSWMYDIGNKVRNVAEFAGTAHGLYQLGRSNGGNWWTATIIFSLY